MSTIPERVGYRIRKTREAKDLSQQEMADKLKLTPGAYAKIERGETDPSISRLYEIAKILNVDVFTFISDEPRQKESPVTRAEFNSMHAQLDSVKKEVKNVLTELKSLKDAQGQPLTVETKKRKQK